MNTPGRLAEHVAIIMDGNGRWATARGLPRILGHRAGAEAVRRVVEAGRELGLRYLTLYAFSWENWDRPSQEIGELMELLDEFIRSELARLQANQIRLRTIGRLEELPPGVLSSLRMAMVQTAQCDQMTLTLALSYGGRQELVDAAKRLAEQVQQGLLRVQQIDEAQLSQALYAPDLPDPDLVIRTSGEQRLSNFLLWQSSYAELYVTPKLWPDFTKDDLRKALADYEHRERRFGRTTAVNLNG